VCGGQVLSPLVRLTKHEHRLELLVADDSRADYQSLAPLVHTAGGVLVTLPGVHQLRACPPPHTPSGKLLARAHASSV